MKKIKEIIISLIVILIISLIMFPVVNKLNDRRENLLAVDVPTDYELELKVSEFPRIAIVEDEKASDKIEATVISLTNKNEYEMEYNLYLFIDNNSNIDLNYLRISLGDTIYKYEYMARLVTTDGTYLELTKGIIDANSEIPMDVRIWVSIDAKDYVDENSKLITNIVTDIKNVD